MSSIISIGYGNGNTAHTQQFFDRLLTPPTGLRESQYASLIDGLYDDGTWTKLDGLYVFAAAEEAAALTNIVSNNYRANYPNDPSDYTVDRFLSPQSGASTIDYHFNPSTAGGNYTRNDACLFAWNLSTADTSGWLLATSTSNIELVPKSATGHTLIALNSATKDDLGTGVADNASGFWMANRTGATALTLDRDGARIATLATASVDPESITITSSYAGGQIAIAGFGASLSDGQISTLYKRLASYLGAVGAI